MVRLVLKGSNKTYDSLVTDYRQDDNTFIILANEFKKRTEYDWDKKYLLSFGLVTGNGYLTNAGALFPMIALYVNHVYIVLVGLEKIRAMQSMMLSLRVMSLCYCVNR